MARMKRRLNHLKRALAIAMLFLKTLTVHAQENQEKKSAASSKVTQEQNIKKAPKTPADSLQKRFERLKKQYRLRELSDRRAWAEFADIYRKARNGGDVDLADLMQTQSYLIDKGKFPILAAKYASSAIIAAQDPYGPRMTPAWDLLKKSSKKRLINDIIIDLATKLVENPTPPAAFGNDWYYYLGEAHWRRNQIDEAIKAFEKLNHKDPHYLAGRYQLGTLLLLEKNDPQKGGLVLKSMLNEDLRPAFKADRLAVNRYLDYATITLARIQYEREKFPSAVKYFRLVEKNSPIFYNSLFEQSWALFMAGYPNHALGALHAAQSPYFPGRFNPEIPVLRSIIYYWMCRYDDAKAALAEFINNYAEPVAKLEEFLARKDLSPEKAYSLFENLLTGVTSESLGISRDLLDSVAKTDPMVLARERLATVMAERNRLAKRGIFGSQKFTDDSEKFLDTWLVSIKSDLGTTYIDELMDLRKVYRMLRSQADFLYVELLLSEKEQALGRELHGDEKIRLADGKEKAKGWGRADVPWAASSKGEFWWDEVGFYVYEEKPLCKDQEDGAGSARTAANQ